MIGWKYCVGSQCTYRSNSTRSKSIWVRNPQISLWIIKNKDEIRRIRTQTITHFQLSICIDSLKHNVYYNQTQISLSIPLLSIALSQSRSLSRVLSWLTYTRTQPQNSRRSISQSRLNLKPNYTNHIYTYLQNKPTTNDLA